MEQLLLGSALLRIYSLIYASEAVALLTACTLAKRLVFQIFNSLAQSEPKTETKWPYS